MCYNNPNRLLIGTNKMSTTVRSHTTESTDHITGEVKSTTRYTQSGGQSESPYVKLYIQDIAYLNNLPSGTDKIIYALLPYVNYNQEIYVNSHNKKIIAEELGVSVGHVNNRISKLSQLEVLVRIDRGVYELNTYLFGKGKWKDILEHRNDLKIQVFYDWKHGRTTVVGEGDNDDN